jgi:zinc protease
MHGAACRAKVSIVGAVNRAQADALVAELLARLPPAAGAARRCRRWPRWRRSAASEQAIPFESAQAHVLIGQPGLRAATRTSLRCWWATTSWAVAALCRA